MKYKYPMILESLDSEYYEITFPDFDVTSMVRKNNLIQEATDLLTLLILGYQDNNETLPSPSMTLYPILEININ